VLSLGYVAVAQALQFSPGPLRLAAIARLLVPKERFMNDAQAPTNGSEQVIQSAGYFRDQAALCLEILMLRRAVGSGRDNQSAIW
jgi:hypothetical protein